MVTIGMKIGNRYQVVKLLGSGGMGNVWECLDLVLKRSVAIKVINEQYLVQIPGSVDILKDEAQLGSKLLGNPHIVSVLDFGEYKLKKHNEKIYFLVMEYVEGLPLDKWINNFYNHLDPLTYYHINLLIAWEICKAINFANQKGVLHRDIKPLNIFLSKIGLAKVGDFGISRFVEAVTRTHTRWQAKSPAYCAPEQWKGNKPNYNTEVYQLGCTLYELFTGKLPFDGDNLVSLMNEHLNKKPVSPKSVNSIISNDISKAILGALTKEETDRLVLWKLHDAIAREIQGNYELKIDVSNEKIEIINLVGNITEFNTEALKKEEFEYVYPDFSEALSEGLQLILSGITNIKIHKKDKKKIEVSKNISA